MSVKFGPGADAPLATDVIPRIRRGIGDLSAALEFYLSHAGRTLDSDARHHLDLKLISAVEAARTGMGREGVISADLGLCPIAYQGWIDANSLLRPDLSPPD